MFELFLPGRVLAQFRDISIYTVSIYVSNCTRGSETARKNANEIPAWSGRDPVEGARARDGLATAPGYTAFSTFAYARFSGPLPAQLLAILNGVYRLGSRAFHRRRPVPESMEEETAGTCSIVWKLLHPILRLAIESVDDTIMIITRHSKFTHLFASLFSFERSLLRMKFELRGFVEILGILELII